jgi:hypothetical protein
MAVMVKEAFKNREPRWRGFDGVVVVHVGVDTASATRMTLGLSAWGEYIAQRFE